MSNHTMRRTLGRALVDYAFGLMALVGVCLIVSAVYLHAALRGRDNLPPANAAVVVSASVEEPTWAPIPNATDTPTPQPTANPWPPRDPGTGPYPVCWIHPGEGLAPGGTCPPKPAGWTPPR